MKSPALVRFESECLLYLKSIRESSVRYLQNDSLPFVLTILRTHHCNSLFNTQVQLLSLEILKAFASRNVSILINEHAVVDIQSLLMTGVSVVQKSAILTLLVVVRKKESILYITRDVCVSLLHLSASASISDLVYQLLSELCCASEILLETIISEIKFSWVISQLSDYERHGMICKFLEIVSKLSNEACREMVIEGLHIALWNLLFDERYQYPYLTMQVLINLCSCGLHLANKVLNVDLAIPVLNVFLTSKNHQKNALVLLLCRVCDQYGKPESNFFLVNVEHHLVLQKSEDSSIMIK